MEWGGRAGRSSTETGGEVDTGFVEEVGAEGVRP